MKNLVAGLLLILTTLPAYAADFSVCFDEPVAKKLYADLEACGIDKQRLDLSDQLNATLTEEVAVNVKLAESCQKELAVTAKSADTFKGAAVKCTEQLQKCEESKPSRLTWAAVGAATVGVVLGVIKFLPFLAVL